MSINWSEFNPITSLLGGGILGIGTIILILFRGRIAGISGIVGALMQFKNTPKDHHLWRILFLLGLVSSSLIYSLFLPFPSVNITTDFTSLILAGVLVGFGTRMGSGCTSGHGICGLGRLSPRSLVATLGFMGAGFITCYIFLHLIN